MGNVFAHGRHGDVTIHAVIRLWWHVGWFLLYTDFRFHPTTTYHPKQNPNTNVVTATNHTIRFHVHRYFFTRYRVGDTIRKRARLRLPLSSTVGGERGRMPLGRVWFVTYSSVSSSKRFVYDRHEDRMMRPEVWML